MRTSSFRTELPSDDDDFLDDGQDRRIAILANWRRRLDRAADGNALDLDPGVCQVLIDTVFVFARDSADPHRLSGNFATRYCDLFRA